MVPCASLSSPMKPLQGSGVSERSRCGASDRRHYELKTNELDQVYPLFHIVNIYYEISITAYDMY